MARRVPFRLGVHLLSDVRECRPALKRSLTTASSCVRSWGKVLIRERAFLDIADMAKTMSTLFSFKGKVHLAVLPVMAFAGLFRLGKLLRLQARYVDILADDFVRSLLSGQKRSVVQRASLFTTAQPFCS